MSVLRAAEKRSTTPSDLKALPKQTILSIYDLMVKSRALEERLIAIYKRGDAFFWIGAPGEEAWGVPLGLLVNKGQGHRHDWLHMHYRATPTLVAMGMPMIDSIRLIMNKATDPSTGGRNFSNHYAYPKWNVAPITSPIEVQYTMATGTAHAQKRVKENKAITVVTGGDAGTAEGDFASCLIWSSRRGQELPILITVQNNKWGISTNWEGQHGEEHIADRAKGFGIPSMVINGNDPIESYLAIEKQMDYIRKTGKPAFIEAHLSRLNGHSSATGAARVENEDCCLTLFEEKLLKAGYITVQLSKETWTKYSEEALAIHEQVRSEPVPSPESVWDHVWVDNENADWRKF
ncbi:MAG: thiamine pyrophosphate-dependent dehydrogenase E1 component subunit alpha [Pseudobdellovibrionaceae bacterium]